MRGGAVRVDKITMETAAEMIVHPTGRHLSKREKIHLQRVLAAVGLRIARIHPREKIQRYRPRGFWRDTESALMRIVTARDLLIGGVERFRAETMGGIGDRGSSALFQRGDDLRP